MNSIFRLLTSILCAACVCPVFAMSTPDQYLNRIAKDPNALYAFFKEMPKGGELHYHLDGGAYAETMLALAPQKSFCVDRTTLVMQPYQQTCAGVTAQALPDEPLLYQQILRAWSMLDFIPLQQARQEHFHAVFAKIFAVASAFPAELLADSMARAADQHELYLEIFYAADNLHSSSFAPLISKQRSWQQKWQTLLNNADFQQNVQDTVLKSQQSLTAARQRLHCAIQTTNPACQLTVKFQYFVLRERPDDEVFAQALTGFLVAKQSPDVVGVNIVQVEDSLNARLHYQHHMQMFDFLHQKYPNVPIAMHAGEMQPAAVPVADLRFHITQAIHLGHAQRIGHGVSIAYEHAAEQLLQYMQQTPVPVEINLTSNRLVLGIKGQQHPLHLYLAHHVPVVLSTDDEGILRTDLTRQYVEAVTQQHLTYAQIKQLNRNALTYSFLPGKSLWQDARRQIAVRPCQSLASEACQQWLAHEPKAYLQALLEKQLDSFEHQHKF